jgi:CIC family chloride channel protein
MFGVIGRAWHRGAMMAVVVRGNGAPSASDVLGVITKEHVADSVERSCRGSPSAVRKFAESY